MPDPACIPTRDKKFVIESQMLEFPRACLDLLREHFALCMVVKLAMAAATHLSPHVCNALLGGWISEWQRETMHTGMLRRVVGYNYVLLILYSGIVPRKRESWPDENMALIWLTE